jgi:hypothetical protein
MGDLTWIVVAQFVIDVLTVVVGGAIGGLIVVGAAALWDRRPR